MLFKVIGALVNKHLQRNFSKMSRMKYLNQEEAINIDLELFNEYRFSVDQLMELAGLSCAHAIAKEFPILGKTGTNDVLIVAGPGNNGGDGLVCARHLSLMNFKPSIYYPKRTDKELYKNLVHQCTAMDIKFLENCPDVLTVEKFRLIVDALFGFSFKPPIRDDFKDVMNLMVETEIPICSVDIPSGWNVERGPESENSINPYMLISLTAPKMCAQNFTGIHYLGGRFVPNSLTQKYQLNLPAYQGTESCLKLK